MATAAAAAAASTCIPSGEEEEELDVVAGMHKEEPILPETMGHVPDFVETRLGCWPANDAQEAPPPTTSDAEERNKRTKQNEERAMQQVQTNVQPTKEEGPSHHHRDSLSSESMPAHAPDETTKATVQAALAHTNNSKVLRKTSTPTSLRVEKDAFPGISHDQMGRAARELDRERTACGRVVYSKGDRVVITSKTHNGLKGCIVQSLDSKCYKYQVYFPTLNKTVDKVTSSLRLESMSSALLDEQATTPAAPASHLLPLIETARENSVEERTLPVGVDLSGVVVDIICGKDKGETGRIVGRHSRFLIVHVPGKGSRNKKRESLLLAPDQSVLSGSC
jgi:hypothetical protein